MIIVHLYPIDRHWLSSYLAAVPNIKFSYLYRDSCNYKNYSYVIFTNPNNLSLDIIEEVIKSKLIDETWFYAKEWNLPDLRFANLDIDNDPTWHEFESVEHTDEQMNTQLSLEGLVLAIKRSG